MVGERDQHGRFVKGAPSPNPGGRPKSLGERIRCETKEGSDVLDFLLAVMTGREKGAKLEHRLQAAQMIMDRGWGKPVQQVDQTVDQSGKLVIEVEYVGNSASQGQNQPA